MRLASCRQLRVVSEILRHCLLLMMALLTSYLSSHLIPNDGYSVLTARNPIQSTGNDRSLRPLNQQATRNPGQAFVDSRASTLVFGIVGVRRSGSFEKKWLYTQART